MAHVKTPIEPVWDGCSADPLGYLAMTLSYEYSYLLREEGGFFSRAKFVEHRRQVGLSVELCRQGAVLWMFHRPKPTEDSAESDLKTLVGRKFCDDIINEKIGAEGFRLHEIGPCEVVNSHQWEGMPPLRIENDRRVVVDEEPAAWDIAAVSHTTGKRIIFMRSHHRKDDVFQLCNLMNMWFDWLRMATAPHQETIKALNPKDVAYLFDKDTPEDEFNDLWDNLFVPVWKNVLATVPAQWDGGIVIDEMGFEDHPDQDEEGWIRKAIKRPIDEPSED